MPPAQSQSGVAAPIASYPAKQTNLVRFFSLKHEFPTEWQQFMHPLGTSQTMSLFLTNERFPFQHRAKKISLSNVQLFLKFKAAHPPSTSSASSPNSDYGTNQLPVD